MVEAAFHEFLQCELHLECRRVRNTDMVGVMGGQRPQGPAGQTRVDGKTGRGVSDEEGEGNGMAKGRPYSSGRKSDSA